MKLFPTLDEWLLTIESSLKGMCVLIHKRVGGDCKGTRVKFGVTEDMVESNHPYTKSDIQRKIISVNG